MPTFREVSPADPVAYVLSLNLHRRQLSTSQLAMIGAKARELYEAQARERQREGGKAAGKGRPLQVVTVPSQPNDSRKTRAIIGEKVGVGGESIDLATKVLKNCTPEIIKQVEDGEIPLRTAARIAKGEESPKQPEPKHESNGREEKAPEEKGEIKLLGKGRAASMPSSRPCRAAYPIRRMTFAALAVSIFP